MDVIVGALGPTLVGYLFTWEGHVKQYTLAKQTQPERNTSATRAQALGPQRSVQTRGE
jgi:hypothetical protein